jgi:RNA polymerase sigma factor (sigma-70 family)
MSSWYERYRGLCNSLVHRFVRSGIEREDLEQVAALGLVKAHQRYTAKRGVAFSTYAWYMVCGELLHYVRDFEKPVRMPRRMWELEHREREISQRIAHAFGRDARADEVAAELGIRPEMVQHIREGIKTFTFTESDATVADDFDQRVMVHDALSKLTPEERAMILGVYYWGYSQSEIGAQLGYAQRRASRLHARAIQRLADAVGEVYV